MPNESPRRLTRIQWALVTILIVILVAVAFLPVLDGPDSRQRADEAVCVAGLAQINRLQHEYADAHPRNGFACDLPLLKLGEPVGQGDKYDSEAFLLPGNRAGYKFAMLNCNPDGNGVIAHYEVTAVPIKRGNSGLRAFCTNDSGRVWYDAAGSPINCLASRHPIGE